MGTLNSFQKQNRQNKTTVEKRAEIDARIKEKVAKEKEEMEADKERLDRERREREEEMKIANEKETVRFVLMA